MIIVCKIVLSIYFLTLLRQVLRVLFSLIIGYNLSYFSLYPIYFINSKPHISFLNKNFTYLNLKPKEAIKNLSLKEHFKNIKIIIGFGLVYDILVLCCLVLGFILSNEVVLYTLLITIYLTIMVLYIFFSDITDVIGAKYDKKIEFTLVSYLDLEDIDKEFLANNLNSILDELLNNMEIKEFDVNNLWNFINNIKFYTALECLKYCKYIDKRNDNFSKIVELLLKEYSIIRSLDYRQIPSVNDLLSLYSIVESDTSDQYLYSKVKDFQYSYKKKNNPLYELIISSEIDTLSKDIKLLKISKVKHRSIFVYLYILKQNNIKNKALQP